MPIMSVKEFEKRTSVGIKRGERFDNIVACLKEYHRTLSHADLLSLRKALTMWQGHHRLVGAAPDSWKLDRRNQIKGKGHPVEELDNWVSRKLIEPTLLVVKSAATDVLKAYGDSMDHVYRANLIEMFTVNPADSADPLYCFYYSEKSAEWTTRLTSIGAPPKTTAFCVPMETKDRTPNAVGMTVRIKSDSPPMNRQIEFGPNPDHGDLFHEFLHWCTHKQFEDHTKNNIADKTLSKFIREGLTEWLTRRGLNIVNRNGYIDFYPIWKEICDNGVVKLNEIVLAYFHGVNLAGFCQKVTPVIQANDDYKTGVAMQTIATGVNRYLAAQAAKKTGTP